MVSRVGGMEDDGLRARAPLLAVERSEIPLAGLPDFHFFSSGVYLLNRKVLPLHSLMKKATRFLLDSVAQLVEQRTFIAGSITTPSRQAWTSAPYRCNAAILA